jgi:hypothetical protein
MLKKTIALAIAVGAIATCWTATAAASWSHQGAIQENVTLTIGALDLKGNVRFQGKLGGIECQIVADVLLEPGTTGSLNSLEPNPAESGTSTSRCNGLGGLASCSIHQFDPTGLPWTVHEASATTIALTTWNFHTSLTGGIFCLVKQAQLTASSLTWTPDNPSAMSKISLSGNPQVVLQTNGGAADKEVSTVSGQLEILSPATGTYAI